MESNVITANVINATTMNATTITANAVTCTTLTPNVIHAENVDWSSSVLYPAWNSWHTINGTTSVLLSSVVSQVVAGAAYAVQIADINNESITIYGAFVNNDSTQ